MTETKKLNGGCMCGAVRYQTAGETIGVIYCHCKSCRRHTGAPVSMLAGFRQNDVYFIKGERKLYASSEGVGRGFCIDCGTTLTWEGDDEELGPLVEIHMGTLDEPDALKPSCHVNHDERVAGFDVAGTLPRYHEWEEEEGPYCNEPVS